MSANSTYDGSTADAALIGPISAANIRRWVYRTYNSVNIVTTRDNPFDDAIGEPGAETLDGTVVAEDGGTVVFEGSSVSGDRFSPCMINGDYYPGG